MPYADAALQVDAHSNHGEHDEELYVGEDGLISVVPVDATSDPDKLQRLLEHRENELRQAAEYGLGLLEANEELQMQVATLKIQLETETDELAVERNTWQRRTEHAKEEVAQWKRRVASLEEEKADLADQFQSFLDHCECRGQDLDNVRKRETIESQNIITQLETALQEAQAAQRLHESELLSLRQWKATAEQQQQEAALACEDRAIPSELSPSKNVEQELLATQRAMIKVTTENDALRNDAQKHEEEVRALNEQLRAAEETIGNVHVQSNELSEKLLSSESQCKRLQRELELLDHVSYFSQAIIDRDDKESNEEDEVIEVEDSQAGATTGKGHSEHVASDARTASSPLGIKQRSLCATTVPLLDLYDDALASEPEKETEKKLHHYFHLTALSIIHENSLHERCFNSSSRVTIDMWYREIIANEIPFLMWHSWLINRISEVAASVQDEENHVKKTFLGSTFHGFSRLKPRRSSTTESAKNCLPSPATVSSSPAPSPIARVPFTVARAFFRLLRKRTRGGVDSSPVD
ncbi:hypothetical protein PsorP6_018549 [Peronosclerospora sorghi]|nr:hypothetical protein PsorP6_018498 [Peronosclerospora sorghi]KAI9895213.1 hypothetical protein PsorP6_018549 [Peronosclerospora sorghi]